jgi:hypothetical protein
VIEEMACEANQEAVFELIGGATAGYGSKEDFDVKLPGFNSSPKCCTKTSKEETLLMETVSEDNCWGSSRLTFSQHSPYREAHSQGTSKPPD